MEETETETCKHCGNLIAKYRGVWIHVRNSELQTGWQFERNKEGKVVLACGIDGCKCENPEPLNTESDSLDEDTLDKGHEVIEPRPDQESRKGSFNGK